MKSIAKRIRYPVAAPPRRVISKPKPSTEAPAQLSSATPTVVPITLRIGGTVETAKARSKSIRLVPPRANALLDPAAKYRHGIADDEIGQQQRRVDAGWIVFEFGDLLGPKRH